MPKKLNLDFTGPQDDFVYSERKYPAIIGGLGSGKSEGGVGRALMLMFWEPGIDIGYYMPTYDLIRLRVIPGFVRFCILNKIPYSLNKSEWIITIKGLGRVIFRSYDNPDRIIAYEVAHSIVDELDTLKLMMALDVWTKVNERNRAETNHPGGNTIANVTTPNHGTAGFSYSRWGEPNINTAQYEMIHAPTLSNIFLPDPEAYIAQIRENYDPITAQAFIDGIFVSFTKNKVYNFYDEKAHDTAEELLPTDPKIEVSIDFNVGGCCSVVFKEMGDKAIAVDEFVSHDTPEFVSNLQRYKTMENGHLRTLTVYPDATGDSRSTNASASDIAIIQQAGFNADFAHSNPFVRDRVNAKNRMLSHDRLLVNRKRCPRYSASLRDQGYTDKGEPEKFNEHPSIDDWTDSAGYYINRRFPINHSISVTGIGRVN